ncbi:MAG: hypothetical protein KTR25_16240 [Myxococcales bacterium]|nr:hypothetical protein [Myxococcales bacterium]
MASNTQQTEKKRQAKNRSQGAARKKALAAKGTTRSEAQLFGNVLER